jgi:hypothetical protein
MQVSTHAKAQVGVLRRHAPGAAAVDVGGAQPPFVVVGHQPDGSQGHACRPAAAAAHATCSTRSRDTSCLEC